jgi:hypothetical protein
MTEIPKIVKQRMRSVAKPSDHPDADLLSALAEKSLGKRERVQVLDHLYACADCREIFSLSTRQPEFGDIAVADPANTRWFSWPVLRWGAVVACVVVVGAMVTLHRTQETPPASKNVVAVVPEQSAQLPRPGPTSMTTLATPLGGHPPSAPVEMADARPVSAFARTVPGRAKESVSESREAEAEKKTMHGEALPTAQNMALADAGEAGPSENLTPRWTLNSDGTLERSLDSGRSWLPISVSNGTIFRALAATALNIWVGGSSGALYHSSDAGQHWTQVQPAVDGEVLIDDIIGVQFTDTLHGKLTTSNDETWTTADAGQTWQK